MKHFKRGLQGYPAKTRSSGDNSSVESPFFRVEGLSAISEFIKHRPGAIRSVHCTRLDRKKLDEWMSKFPVDVQIEEIASDRERAQDEYTQTYAEVELHTLGWQAFKQIAAKDLPRLILICDHIVDPRNVGAIVRTAAFFGVPFVLAPERRQALLTRASVVTSQGGFALTDLVNVGNLNRACEELKELGFWLIGSDMSGESLLSIPKNEYQHMAIIMGSEHEGVSALVQKACDRTISIPGASRSVESLNVSVACGIVLNHFFLQEP